MWSVKEINWLPMNFMRLHMADGGRLNCETQGGDSDG